MMRSFAVALVSLLFVSGFAPFERLAAQGPPPPQVMQVPVDLVGGVPGLNIELFINNGKSGDVTVSVSGDASWVLDMSNFGKTRVSIYIDVCKDGKVVKVLFVTGNGQPPPKDEDCDRKLVAVGFQSDCGVTRITLNITQLGARVIGCGSMFTQPKVFGPVIGGIVVGGLLITNGGGTTTTASTPTPTTTTTVTVTVPTAPAPAPPPVVVPTPTNTTQPAPTTPTPPVTANGTYRCILCTIRVDTSNHNPTLRVCDGLTGNVTVTEGSLTIRHPSPFIDVTGANYNTTSGAFDLTGRGSVAGFNNVNVRAVGTVTNSTGRIVFDYTLGTAGEFPGGQPITYAVTLQKQ